MVRIFDKKVVLFLHGLGNQLFQFTFMLYLKEKQGKCVKYNNSFYKKYNVHEGFQANLIFDFSDFKESKVNFELLYRLCRRLKFRRSTWAWGKMVIYLADFSILCLGDIGRTCCIITRSKVL